MNYGTSVKEAEKDILSVGKYCNNNEPLYYMGHYYGCIGINKETNLPLIVHYYDTKYFIEAAVKEGTKPNDIVRKFITDDIEEHYYGGVLDMMKENNIPIKHLGKQKYKFY